MPHFWRTCTLALALSAAGAQGPCSAQEASAKSQHAWGRFSPGAWKTVRTLTESLDRDGKVSGTSTSETTTTLTAADDETFTLRIEATVEVAGKRIVAEPQTVTERYSGLKEGQEAQANDREQQTIAIDGVSFPCLVRQVEVAGEVSKTVTRLWYCDSASPHVLRRESTSTDLAGQSELSASTMEVTAVEMPFLVCGEIKPTTHAKVQQRHAKGSSVALDISAADVPGGVVSHVSKELDADGRVVRRSTLELVAFGLSKERRPRRFRLFRRND